MPVRTAAILLASWSLAAPALAQAPRDPSRPTAAAATIAGVVLSDERPAKPLRRARVLLTGSGTFAGRTAVTGDDGTFVFEGLPADDYAVRAAKDGYVAVSWGAARPGRPGRDVVLRAGESRRLTLRLPRGSVITGMIADAQGQPVAGIRIDVLGNQFDPSTGERHMVAAGSPALTDDRGDYRVFDLPAGDYLVAAHVFPEISREMVLQVLSAQEVRRALAELRDTRLQALPGIPKPMPYKAIDEPRQSVGAAPVFYPGTVVQSKAVTVTLGAGEQRAGVDFEVQFVPTATVSGTVPIPAGAAAPVVTLIPDADAVGPDGVRGRQANGDGAFTFTGVPPGRYTLLARRNAQAARSMSAPAWGSTGIVVDGQDLTGLSLPLQPGLTLSGRVAFEGTARRPPLRARFELPIASAMHGVSDPRPVVETDAVDRFRVDGIVPGTYRLERADGLRTPLANLWLTSVVVNGREVLDAPIELRQSADDAVVTLSGQTSDINGVVTDPRGVVMAGQTVVLFATDRKYWFFESRRVAAGRTNAQGRYRIRTLPAGDYYALVTDDMNEGEWFDPVALDAAARAATVVRVEQDEEKTINLSKR